MQVQLQESNKLANLSLEPLDPERQRLIELIRRWGGLTADALLNPACKFFRLPGIDGIIGYRDELGCLVVYGDPVCSPADVPQLVHAFHNDCQKQGKKIVYITTSEKFARWAIQTVCKSLVEFGEELFLDPHCSPREKHGTHASLVRRKVRHALREESTAKEYLLYDAQLEEAIEQAGITWLKSRRGPQMHISHIHLFDDRPGKRWFYAQKGEKVMGVVILNQIQAKQGWLLNHLMITPDAPHGTSELLVITALETLQSEGCRFVTFGAAPAEKLSEILGLSPFSSWMARQLFKIAHQVFHLKGHKMFWGKFQPQSAQSYLLFSHSQIGISELIALKRAMNVSF